MISGSLLGYGRKDLSDMDAMDTVRSELTRRMRRLTLNEEDPNGKEANEEGAKLDSGKPDCDLLLMFGKALWEVAQVGTFGKEKYTRGGWQSVPDGETRYRSALLRHLFQGAYEDNDIDSGLLHAAHAAWNALAVLELRLRKVNEDNDAG